MLQKIISDIGSGAPSDIPMIVIMGPTATGKSALALRIAQKLPVEIISADSMQLYKGMNIGVAKPTDEERRNVRHHLIDILDISEPVNVFRYVELAEKAICAIRSRNRIPLLAGGSGMYIRALLYGLDPLPGDLQLRDKLNREFDSDDGFIRLKELMKEIDPEDLHRWKHNRRKLIRAFEVFQLTGNSITELQKSWKSGLRFPVKAWRIVMDRELLRERIAERTDKMLASGWIEETAALIEQGLLTSPTARQAIGYSVIADFLDGAVSRNDMRKRIVTVTAQFARRQESWFRTKHPEAVPLKLPVA